MKQSPKENKIQSAMMPGVITLSGFLGNDIRPYHEIIREDEQLMETLGVTAEQISDRMEYLQQQAYGDFMGPILVEDHLEIEFESVRGRMICPFGHAGKFAKGIISCHNRTNGLTISWTPLSIHFIKVHHFFEGSGSPFRLEPETLVKTLF